MNSKTAIAELSFLLDLDEELRGRILTAFLAVSEISVRDAGTALIREGQDDSDSGFVLISGSVNVAKSTGGGGRVAAPALFGEMKQFGPGGQRVATVSMEESGEVAAFSWTKLYREMETRIDAGELEQFRDALRRYAWKHLLDE
ncbi:MAG: cyclic nucleotide-binding domain-containing protein [Candidatus Hydrogenedentota bacterium]